MNIADRLDAILKERKLSHYRLAKMSGFTQPYISAIVRGDRTPPVASLEKICFALGITLAEFFAGADDKSINALPGNIQIRKSNSRAEKLCDLIYTLDDTQLALLEAMVKQMKK